MAYHCIYCNTEIPADVGMRCYKCAAPSKGRDEFAYADEIEPHVADMIRRVEQESDIVKSSQQTQEEFFRLHEKNANARKEHQFPNQEELKKAREGQILHMNDFLTKLKRCGLNCWYGEKGGMKGTTGLYVGHDKTMRCSHEYGAVHFVCFVQVPFMQEYEELNFDQYNVPLGSKRRGWRTVLLNLIQQGLLTADKADQIFGAPATGPVSRRYKEYLSYLRTR
jgi:hypothetical protein